MLFMSRERASHVSLKASRRQGRAVPYGLSQRCIRCLMKRSLAGPSRNCFSACKALPVSFVREYEGVKVAKHTAYIRCV